MQLRSRLENIPYRVVGIVLCTFEEVDKDGCIEREVTAACHFWTLFSSHQQSLHSTDGE